MSVRTQSQRSSVRVVVAAALGNALEWFDFIIYGYLAVILSRLFFPADDPNVALMLTLATFAVGFVMRPVGALVMGYYADRKGRRSALTITIWIMALATAMIGFAPTYATVGLLAPVIVLTARLMQGFAASGEYGSAVSLLAESAPPNRKATFVAWQMASTLLAVVFAGLVGFLLFNTLTPQQMGDWGWRLPFIFGLLIAPVGYYIRRHVDETLDVASVARTSWSDDIRQIWTKQRRAFLASFALLAFGGGNFYIMFIYMPTFAVRELNLGLNAPFVSTLVAGLLSAAGAIFWAGRVDRGASPRLLYGIATVAILLIAYPLYAWIIQAPTLWGLVALQVALAIPGSVIVGLGIVMNAALFEPRIRASILGFNFNVSNSIFGGAAPLMVSYAVATSGDKAAAAYYVILVGLIGLIGVCCLPGKAHTPRQHEGLGEPNGAPA